MNSRLNAIPTIEGALRLLESYAYDTSSLWAEHHSWLAQFDARKPTDHDVKWATRADEPSPISEHIGAGLDQFEQLTASNAFGGRQFLLSSGQRDVLRERHGLTPTKVVLLRNAVCFPGSNVLYQLTIESVEHVTEDRRKHVLISAVINAASFFEAASERDKEREAARAVAEEKADKKRVERGEAPRSVARLAAMYFA